MSSARQEYLVLANGHPEGKLHTLMFTILDQRDECVRCDTVCNFACRVKLEAGHQCRNHDLHLEIGKAPAEDTISVSASIMERVRAHPMQPLTPPLKPKRLAVMPRETGLLNFSFSQRSGFHSSASSPHTLFNLGITFSR